MFARFYETNEVWFVFAAVPEFIHRSGNGRQASWRWLLSG
jgi:hypothetical protein